MIDFNNISNLYFLGIGGIGMSALARYAKHSGKNVAGYDLTQTELTQALQTEGIDVHYTEDINRIPSSFNTANTLIVRTPAVPATHSELQWLQQMGYLMVKRSELLGYLTQGKFCVAVAGTHGKTSVSTMVTHLLLESGTDVGAFLGGISRNFQSNLVLPKSNTAIVVAEADEFDRSFLQLNPSLAVITSMDADHLDIYGTHDAVIEAFSQFVAKVVPNGIVLAKKGLPVKPLESINQSIYSYTINDEADFCIRNFCIVDGSYIFDFVTPDFTYEKVKCTYPGRVNVENMVAAGAAAILCGADPIKVTEAFATYKGVQRRFDIRYQDSGIVYIDDYAHHPEELKATIRSVRELYQGKKILGVFQPHLFTRTRDFANEFAASLDELDEAVVLDIYPARELPIPGITANTIVDRMGLSAKSQIPMNALVDFLSQKDFDVLLTLGAGNIDTLCPSICKLLTNKHHPGYEMENIL
jgi:UDP-N-acetylmuramate--alanine ligase